MTRAGAGRGSCPQRGRRYSRDAQQAAVDWAADHGAAAAAAKLGMSAWSVLRWTTTGARKAERMASAKRERAGAVVATTAAASLGAPEPGAGARRARHGRRFSVAEKKAILEHAAAHGVSAAAAQFVTSRWSVYEWLRRRRASAVAKSDPDAGLEARSSRPKRITGKLSEERHHLIAETWLRNQALGPRQVRNVLRRNHALRVGTSTVRRVMEEQGYVPPRITVERRPSRRYEAVRPNQQWHLDFVQFFLHKAKLFLLLIEDDFSRYLPGFSLCEGERAQPVLETIDRAIERHGRPEQMVVDGGSGFFSWRGESQLERLCGDYGIDFIKATKRGSNSKLEALNANVRKELLSKVEFADVAEARVEIARWVRAYNCERVHEGLGGLLVPADRYFGRSEEVLAQIERGDPVVVPGPLSPDARALELFRVISRSGRPELWLLGERVWPAVGPVAPPTPSE
jgi:putative transposase